MLFPTILERQGNCMGPGDHVNVMCYYALVQRVGMTRAHYSVLQGMKNNIKNTFIVGDTT